MKVLVVGSGGREHALVWKISQSPLLTALHAAPGSAAIAELATCHDVSVGDLEGLVEGFPRCPVVALVLSHVTAIAGQEHRGVA